MDKKKKRIGFLANLLRQVCYMIPRYFV